MKKALLLVALCASSSWATFSGYTYRREYTIAANKVSTQTATLTNFPVLVTNFDLTLTTQSSGGHLSNASGFDQVFSTMQDCSFLLNWDTETINTVGVSTENIWVRIPSVSSTTDTPFFRCYGNAATTTYQGYSTGTWDSNYAAVWHMNTLSGNQPDSTSNGNVAQSSGTVFYGKPGVVDGSIQMNASGHAGMFVNPISSNLNITGSSMTLYTTVFSTANSSGQRYLSLGILGNGTGSVLSLRINSSANPATIQLLDSVGSATQSGAKLSLNTWTQMAITRDGTNVKYYFNGVLDSVVAQTMDAANGSFNMFTVGRDVSSLQQQLNGTMDETEISTIDRSYGWIQTEYNSQFNPSTFYSMGPEEQTPPSATNQGLVILGGELNIKGGRLQIQ